MLEVKNKLRLQNKKDKTLNHVSATLRKVSSIPLSARVVQEKQALYSRGITKRDCLCNGEDITKRG